MTRRLVLVVALLVGAACTGDDASDDTSTPTSTETPATSPASSTPAPSSTSTTTTLGPPVDPGEVRPAVEPAGETVEGSLVTPDGRTRTHRVYVPADLPEDPPLLIALHGGLGNGAQLARTSGFDGLAEANGFLVAYAEGTPTAVGPRNLVWNAGGCCAAAAEAGVDDVGYLRTLIETLVDEYDVDPSRVLMTGHSNGGMMALRMACESTDQIAAVAVQAGTVFVDECTRRDRCRSSTSTAAPTRTCRSRAASAPTASPGSTSRPCGMAWR